MSKRGRPPGARPGPKMTKTERWNDFRHAFPLLATWLSLTPDREMQAIVYDVRNGRPIDRGRLERAMRAREQDLRWWWVKDGIVSRIPSAAAAAGLEASGWVRAGELPDLFHNAGRVRPGEELMNSWEAGWMPLT